VWGGSWAIRRELFDQTGLHGVWNGALTDDLVATNLVRQAGFRVEFEPACVIASPVDNSFVSMFQFLRRQYMIGRHYMLGMWTLTLLATTLTVIGFWGAMVAAGVGLKMHAPGAWWPAMACLLLYGLGMFRATIRRDLAHLYLPRQRHALFSAIRFDFWTTPLTALLNWAAILSTVWARSMVWRGVTYRLLPRGRTQIVHRLDETSHWPAAGERKAWGLENARHAPTGDPPLPRQKQDRQGHRKAA
jgi:hypothetical protein